jgi:hypothetical protein
MKEILRRRDATQATLEWFATRPFAWKDGATCVHMVRKQLVALGHKPPPMKAFRSALGAKKALQAKGWASLAEMMGSILPAIPPARAMIGDIVELPSDDAVFGALCIVVGNGRVMGYFEGAGDMLTVMQPIDVPIRAWRV